MYSVLFAGLAVPITRADFKTCFIFLFINPYLFKICDEYSVSGLLCCSRITATSLDARMTTTIVIVT